MRRHKRIDTEKSKNSGKIRKDNKMKDLGSTVIFFVLFGRRSTCVLRGRQQNLF